MNKIYWAIQTNLINEEQVQEMIGAVEQIGHELIKVTVIPFSDDLIFDKEINDVHNVIPYGSTKLTKLGNINSWNGTWFDSKNFNMKTSSQCRSDMLNSDAHFTTVGEVNKLFDKLGFSDNTDYFIRPVHDLKEFNGTVTTIKEIRNWMKSPESGNFSFDSDTEVMVSRPKKIDSEYRLFIVDGKIVEGSRYRLNGRLSSLQLDQDQIDHLQETMVNGKWLPNVNCVMDVALCNGEFSVIEFNCINSSGFYACDIPNIVNAMSQSLLKKLPIKCWCEMCDIAEHPNVIGGRTRMSVCPICHNKRCKRAGNHNEQCSNS